MTLNSQTYLKKILKRFYLASIPEWIKYEQNFGGMVLDIGSSFEKYNKFINSIINLPRGV